MRLDTQVSRATRIEVVTEGVLTRMLQSDPSLEDVGALIFDEHHERSLQADLGLALSLDARDTLTPDLRLVIMSATLDGERVAALIGDAPIVSSQRPYIRCGDPVRREERAAPAGPDRCAWLAGFTREGCRADRARARSKRRAATRSCSCLARGRFGACRRFSKNVSARPALVARQRGHRQLFCRCSAIFPRASRTPRSLPRKPARAKSCSPRTSPKPASRFRVCASLSIRGSCGARCSIPRRG